MTFEFNRIIKEETWENNLVQNHSCKGLENEQITSGILKKQSLHKEFLDHG